MSDEIVRREASLDIAALLKRAWDQFLTRPIEHIVASLVVVVLGVISLGILIGPLSVGYIQMVDKQRRGESIAVNDVFSGFDHFWPAFWTTLISVLGITLGFICLVVPGLFLMAAWGYALWFVALEGQTTSDALGSSWRLLKEHTGSVVVVIVIDALINAIGSAFVLATLLTVPFVFIFTTLSFSELRQPAPRVV